MPVEFVVNGLYTLTTFHIDGANQISHVTRCALEHPEDTPTGTALRGDLDNDISSAPSWRGECGPTRHNALAHK